MILEQCPHSWLSRSVSVKLQFCEIKRFNSTMASIYMYEAMDTTGTCLRICTVDFSKVFGRETTTYYHKNLIILTFTQFLLIGLLNFLLTDASQQNLDLTTLVGSKLWPVSYSRQIRGRPNIMGNHYEEPIT